MLYPFSDLIESPDHLTDKVVTVNDLSAVFKEGAGNVCVLLPHITYEEAYPFTLFWRPLTQIANKGGLTSVRKNIKNSVRSGVSNDSLIFLISGIALKLINSEYMREFLRFRDMNSIKNSE